MIRRAVPRGAPGGGDVTGGGAGRRPVNKARPAGTAAAAVGAYIFFYFSISPPPVAPRVCGSGPRHPAGLRTGRPRLLNGRSAVTRVSNSRPRAIPVLRECAERE